MNKLILTLFLCCGFLNTAADTKTVPPESRFARFGESTMELSDGLFFVMGKIKGGRVGRFLIDLGASHTIVSRSAIGKSEAYDSSLVASDDIPDIRGLRGKIPNIVGRVTLENFTTGKIKIMGVPALVVDSLHDFDGRSIMGILGLDLLSRAPCLTITMTGGRKAKYRLVMEDCRETRAAEIWPDSLILENDFIILPGSLNGQPISFILDTGSRYTFITPEAAQRHNVSLDSSHLLTYQGLDLHRDTAMAGQASDMNLGQSRLDQIALFIGNIPQACGDSYTTDGIIGNDILRRFHRLEINFDHRLFKLTP